MNWKYNWFSTLRTTAAINDVWDWLIKSSTSCCRHKWLVTRNLSASCFRERFLVLVLWSVLECYLFLNWGLSTSSIDSEFIPFATTYAIKRIILDISQMASQKGINNGFGFPVSSTRLVQTSKKFRTHESPCETTEQAKRYKISTGQSRMNGKTLCVMRLYQLLVGPTVRFGIKPNRY